MYEETYRKKDIPPCGWSWRSQCGCVLLCDILEDDADVDEKFYLKAQTVQNLISHKLRNEAVGRNYGAVFHCREGKMHAIKIGGKGVDDLVRV